MHKSLLFTLLFAVASMIVAVDAAPQSSGSLLSDRYVRYLSEAAYDYSPEYYGYTRTADGKTVVYHGSAESFEWDDLFERRRLVATKDLTLRDILTRISARPATVY
ncbi:uncharacterized protein LOC130691627 [Daphnia carinata]|uniref:uncharacterized protein LOC130691627 n=1 Tax=Daphnia carinata TaxID=120202 RepID=UPI002579FE7D|nr:uncharacterized protein LOC130691627 [Daphnia carinata]